MGYVIAGNWKMNGSPASALALAAGLTAKAKDARAALPRIVLCPPSPLLSAVAAATSSSEIAVGAQDCHAKEKGAHTGDISAVLLRETGCRYVIVGHSERRADHGETDVIVRAKAEAALRAGLTPIVCVGETEAERAAGQTEAIVARQVANSLPQGFTAANTIIAYEPVWAIGTGKVATPADIAAVHAHIRKVTGSPHGPLMPILYGGSVKGSNAAEILATPGVDGALVGGASLDIEDFWRIITACPRT